MSADIGASAFDRRAWADAFAELSSADRATSLEPEGLQRLATAAYLVGKDDESVAVWERAHQALLSRGERRRAVACAGWIVFVLINGGQAAPAGGWIARGLRLLEDEEASV